MNTLFDGQQLNISHFIALSFQHLIKTTLSCLQCIKRGFFFGLFNRIFAISINGCVEHKEAKMRKVILTANDFEMFDTEISSVEFEFYQKHRDAFPRMWKEQVGF